MGTNRLERRFDSQRIENSVANDENVLLSRASPDEKVYVISDDESDFVVGSTSHVAAHHDDSAPTAAAFCDSCQFCNDICDVPNCVECLSKTSSNCGVRVHNHQQRQRCFTMCQIRRHDSIENSVWIVADDTVYDVTNYIQYHPGGMGCILKKAGGKQNCRRDLQFHSQRGQQLFNKCAIGKVISCPGCVSTLATSNNTAASTATKSSRPFTLAALEKYRWFSW